MIINVTQYHIDRGCRESCRGCPIALALSDAGVSDPHVEGDQAGAMRADGLHDWFRLPSRVRRFIQAFDAGSAVEPFSFPMPDAAMGDAS